MILSVVVYYLRRLDHLFWRILCQIRIIKYCAEPSVSESPKHEGSLQRRARFTELLRISPASPEHYPGTPAIRNSSNQAAIATCHALRWRQRYCQTRYTRRNWFIQPALYQRVSILRSTMLTRIGKRVKSSAYSKATDLWVYLQTTMWIASRLIKSMRFNTTWVVYQRMPISPQALVSNPRGWITNIYTCNIIHEISLGYCEPNGVQGESIVNTVFSILRITGLYTGVSGL